MIQGQRTPFQNGMPNRFMGPAPMRSTPMRSHFMQQSPFGPAQMNYGRSPFPPAMSRGPQSRRSGGILARLLGRSNSGQGGAPPILTAGGGASRSAGQGGGILQALTNPGSINGFLNNTQQVLKTVQQFGPMVQQYGPMVRNIPMMWKLYRGFKDLPSSDETDTVLSQEIDIKEEKGTEENNSKKKNSKVRVEQAKNQNNKKKNAKKGVSTPKLFI